ncbi:MAG TPA: HAD-IA family hydrolase [Polyangiaceae bacterium]|jgi:phosphoglycolate phosphatase|nr:HAD-IA family hydrolase [Polyangiaceae bacterium]
MPNPRAIVFDLDGTLIDSSRDIAAAVNHALARAGLAALSVGQVKRLVGDGAGLLVARASGLDEHDARFAPLLADFLDYYTANPATFSRPCAGALDALESLGARLSIALATNKPRQTTDATLRALHLERYFRVVVAGGDAPAPKPSPEPLLFIAERLGLQAADLVMVGDGPQDIQAGRAAGARTVAVLGGMAAQDRVLAAEPDAVLETLEELPALIERWSVTSRTDRH